jgi:hypothetical protein
MRSTSIAAQSSKKYKMFENAVIFFYFCVILTHHPQLGNRVLMMLLIESL